MKISLKLDPDTLAITHKIICDEYNSCNADKFEKSLRAELWEILSKKCIAYTNNPNGKPRTINLRYHLACILQECINDFLLVKIKRFGTYEYIEDKELRLSLISKLGV